jgi:hypothetical protein
MNMPSSAPPNTHANTIELIPMEPMLVTSFAFTQALEAWPQPEF